MRHSQFRRSRGGDEIAAIVHGDLVVGLARNDKFLFKRRRPVQRDLGATVNECGQSSAGITAVSRVRRSAKATSDVDSADLHHSLTQFCISRRDCCKISSNAS